MPSSQTGPAVALWPLWLTCAMFGSALTLASFVKVLHSVFLSRSPDKLGDVKEASAVQLFPMVVLAGLCVFFGIFYTVPLKNFIYPAVGGEGAISGLWESGLATILIVVGILIGLAILASASFAKKVRIVPTWFCGERPENDQMIIPGTHFYKTVSSMNGLRQLYSGQEKGWYDSYEQGGKAGLMFTQFLKMMHNGVLSMYLTWVVVGLVLILFVICEIW